MTTNGTFLRSITSIYVNNLFTLKLCLVLHKLFQFGEFFRKEESAIPPLPPG